MAPIDAEFSNSNAKPLFFIGTHAAIVTGLIVTIVRFVYKAHRDTPPALHTRHKHTVHRSGVFLFSVLTTLSVLVASYHALAWRYASYVNWAAVARTDVPGTLWDGWYANAFSRDREGTVLDTLNLSGWQLGNWFSDTDLAGETNSAAIGSARGFWWTYQNFVGLIIWSVFAGIEGRHRNVPTKITLSFILLAQLASLSVAQNLFFILLLLTPMPLGEPPSATDSPTLVPYYSVLSIPALISFLVLGFLPRLTKHSLFPTLTSLGYFILPLLLATLAQPNSLHKERKHKTAAEARKSYEDVFRGLAFSSLVLHGIFTFRAIIDNAPSEEYSYFKHNFVWNTHQPEHDIKTRSQQAWTAFVTIMAALSDNPVIGQVGWDVLLSALSLCVWSVSHGVDVISMLRCSCLKWTLPRVKVPTLNGVNDAKLRVAEVIDEVKDDITTTPVKRARGRPRKTSAAIARDHVSSDAVSTPARRRTRAQSVTESEDSEFQPTAGTERQVDAWDVDEPGEADAIKETEAAALGWGLFVLGGLGAVSASVLGAETSGR